MATKIRDIIDYYSGHNVPDEIKERVLDRISNTQDDKEANEAFRELWDKADSAYMEEEEISAAYNRLFETEETREIEKKKSQSRFAKAFKNYYGAAPLEYKRKHNLNKDSRQMELSDNK